MSKYVLVVNDELYHHGIKGQKWGVRRFRNNDGSLTTKGHKRYVTSKAYDDYKKAIRAFEKAEYDEDDLRSSVGMSNALKAEKEAKKRFTKEDKKQVKLDKKENKRISKENLRLYKLYEKGKLPAEKVLASNGNMTLASAKTLIFSDGMVHIK